MAWFWTIFQLLICLSASFRSCGMKMLHEIWYKLEDWIKRYLIQTYHRLSQEYFKSYRIAFRVALWLDFEQFSSYLFVYRRLLGVAVWICYMEFDTNWRTESTDILFKLTTDYLICISIHKPKLLGWLCGLILNNYPVTYSFNSVSFELRYENVTWNLIQNWRIESTDKLFKLTTGYLKSISSFKEEFLGWLYGLFSNNYPVTYSFIGFFVFTAEKYHLEFESKLKDWINRYLIETWQRLFQEYIKPYRIGLVWLYGLFSNNYPATYSFIGVFLELRCGIKTLHGTWSKIVG